jgi:transcriptional regulator with XRE-family HTH domain
MGRDNPTACYRELGDELRKIREAAGLSGVDLSIRVGWSPSKISRIESGRYNISDVDLLQYLGFCGVYLKDAHDLLALCRKAKLNLGYWLSPHGEWLPDSLGSLIFHESTAWITTWYDPLVVNGLLQTPDYARAMIGRETWRSPEDLTACVQIRLDRQRILRRPQPPRLTFFVHEDALRRQVGSPALMHEQLLRMVLLAAVNHVRIRVVPAHATFGGQFCLFRFDTYNPLVYLENPSSAIFLEDKEYVEPYQKVLNDIAKLALHEGESRELIANLANEYDRGSDSDVGDRVEEEQL